MNPRLEGIVERFAENKGLSGDLSLKYEHFANYIILRDEYFKLNDCYPYESNIDKQLLEHIDFGRNRTESIDGFFCIIQDSSNIIHIDTKEDEIIDWIKTKTNIRFNVILIQTKKSSLDTKNLTDLVVILNSHYDEQPNWKCFFDFKKIVGLLMKEKQRFDIGFTLIYALGGKKDPELYKSPNFIYKVDTLKKTMKEFFWIDDESKLNINFYDGADIINLYETQSKIMQAVDKIVDLSLMTRLEKCGSLAGMRLCTITVKEFKKIIYDFESKRPYQLYEYNVRHSLDKTPVNEKITETLRSESENIKFPLLNNGVTIIVDSMVIKGDNTLELKNIRIVNGCQTSHTILKNCISTDIYDHIVIPIKIIETQNEDILSEITFSSNNQNSIQAENLISLDKNIMLLEKAYNDFNLTNERTLKAKYYFERRQGQHHSIDRRYVVDIPEQSRDFVSIWLRKPHMPLQYKDQTLSEFRMIINSFVDEKRFAFFKLCILSGILWCKLYDLIKAKYEIYEPGRYHILCSIVYDKLQNLYKSSNVLLADDFQRMSFVLSKIEESESELILFMNSETELNKSVEKVCSIIDSIEDLSKSAKGRIHYRKFYPVKIIDEILKKIDNKNGTE